MNLARLSWEKVVVVVGLALDADVLQPGRPWMLMFCSLVVTVA